MFGQHIRLRWWQRGGRDDPKIEDAWEQAESVAIPGRLDVTARVHEETGTVIIRKGGGPGTVMDAKNMILYKDGRLVCGNCMEVLQRDYRCPNDGCPN